MARTVPEHYERQCITHDLISRTGDLAVYRLTGRDGDDLGYEVVRIRRHKADVRIGGKLVHEVGGEYLPSSKDWGQHGWTYTRASHEFPRVAAMAKVQYLMEKPKMEFREYYYNAVSCMRGKA